MSVGRRLAFGFGSALCIFAVFVAYAFLSPATYEASALVGVTPGASELPPPLEASRRLRDAVLDRQSLGELANLKVDSTAVEIRTADGRAFRVSLRGSNPTQIQRLCNALARRASTVASQVLAPGSALEGPRSQNLDALLAFFDAYPEIGALVVGGGERPPTTSALANLTASALREEHTRLIAELESNLRFAFRDAAHESHSKRRIAAIDRLLQARGSFAGSGAPDAKVVQRWAELLHAFYEAPPPGADSENGVTAEILQEAPLPSAPVKPDRNLILLLGALVSLGIPGVLMVALGALTKAAPNKSRQPHDTHSARPNPKPRAESRDTLTPNLTSRPPSPEGPTSRTNSPSLSHAADTWNPGSPERKPAPTPALDRIPPLPTLPVPPPLPVTAPQFDAAARGNFGGGGAPQTAAKTNGAASVYASDSIQHSASANAPAEAALRSAPQMRTRVTQVLGSPASGARPRGTARVVPLDMSQEFRPDAALSPASRKPLRDALLPFSPRSGFVTAVLGDTPSAAAKSRLAAELALALSATRECRLLLVEGDFANPQVHRLFKIAVPISAGFSLQLQTHRHESEDTWTVIHCNKQLDMLLEGSIRAPQAFLAERLGTCLNGIKHHYDLVLVDGPLLSQAAQCRALDDLTDGLIIVSTQDESTVRSGIARIFSQKPFTAVVPS